MNMKESKRFWSRKRSRGQSIVEFALMAPILLIILSGLFEFGFIFMHYLSVLDAVRNSARYISNGIYNYPDDGKDCASTQFFYRLAACEAISELADEQPTISLCLPTSALTDKCDPADPSTWDDVIVSVFTLLRKASLPLVPQITRFPTGTGDMGWSYDADLIHQDQSLIRTGMNVSRYTSGQVWGLKMADTPNTGYVLVEINYNYNQVLALPWFSSIIHDPIPFNLYAFWPCESAEPMATPRPTPVP
jgi:hypothetical protein